jgi:hypothetical protein
MKKLALRIAPPTIVLLAACGGNVVVDTTGGTGAGTSTSTSTATQTGGGGGTTTLPGVGSVGGGPGAGGATCFNLPNPAALSLCGGSSGGGSCSFIFCDTSSNMWEADCSSSACSCTLNGMELCTCALSSAGDFCNGTPDCCFHK